MESWDEVAAYLAVRVRSEFVNGTEATREELLQAARARGVITLESDLLTGQGYYIPRPLPVILLRSSAPLQVLAHELGHHVIEDNLEHECDYDLPLAIYPYPEDPLLDPLERACNLFASIVIEGVR